jgi:tRNA(Arg) A34 adenosine deaminase TadA
MMKAGAKAGKAAMTFMERALIEARQAAARGEVPVGCLIVDGDSGEVLARTANRTEELGDPTAHAEMLGLSEATRAAGAKRLTGCDLYVTLEPCPMCAQAISFARIRRLYFGAYDAKGGGVEHGPRIFSQPTSHHTPQIYGGIAESDCAELLTEFFGERR